MSIQRIDVTWNASDLTNCFGFRSALEQLGFNYFSNNGSNICYFGHTGDVSASFNIVQKYNGERTIRVGTAEIGGLDTSTNSYRIYYEKNSSGDVLFGFNNSSASTTPLTLVALSAIDVVNNQDSYIYGRVTSYTATNLYASVGSNNTYSFYPSQRATSDYIKTLAPVGVGDCIAKKSYFSYLYRQGEDSANYTEFTMNDKNYCSSAYGLLVIEL